MSHSLTSSIEGTHFLTPLLSLKVTISCFGQFDENNMVCDCSKSFTLTTTYLVGPSTK